MSIYVLFSEFLENAELFVFLFLHSAPESALYNLCSETLSKSQPVLPSSAVVGGNICLSRVLTGTMAWPAPASCADGDSDNK